MAGQKTLGIILVAALLAGGAASAHQMASKGGGPSFAFGRPGKEAEVTKTIHVEANDQMRLQFDSMDIKRGDVVKFVVKNVGQLPHEFTVGDEAFRREHLEEMRKMGGMEHDDPNAVSLKPGETRTLIWRFAPLHTRDIIFACYVPGHYEAGMYHKHLLLK